MSSIFIFIFIFPQCILLSLGSMSFLLNSLNSVDGEFRYFEHILKGKRVYYGYAYSDLVGNDERDEVVRVIANALHQ